MSGWIIFLASILALAGIYVILAMVLNLEAGWAGFWDLGIAGLFAVGAYVFVILTVQADTINVVFAPELPLLLGILGGALATGLVAFILGIIALRMRGEFFLITTFAFSVVIIEIIKNQASVTMGPIGINTIERPFDQLVSTRNYNFVLLGLVAFAVVAVYIVTKRLGQSPFGRLLRSQRDNEAVALSLGKNVTAARLRAFVIAGLLIGVAAPLYVWYIRSLTPSMFNPLLTFTVWTALVIGGMGNFRGPLLGGMILILLTEATNFLQVSFEYANVIAALRPIIIGLLLIVIMRVQPGGLLPERLSFDGERERLSGPEASRRLGRQSGAV